MVWDGYGSRVKISFNNGAGTEDLTSFPVPLALTNNTNEVDFSKIQAAGQDIRFTDASGNALPYEIESWTQSPGNALVWVLVPTIHKMSTTDYIWLYYGNSGAQDGQMPKAVWTSYVGVYHLADDLSGSTTVKDSTGNAPGTWNPKGGGSVTPGSTAGQFAGAVQFANNSYVDVSNPSVFAAANDGSAITSEAWFQVTTEATKSAAYILWEENYCAGWSFGVWDQPNGNTGAANASLGLTQNVSSCANHQYTYAASMGKDYSTGGAWHYETLVVDRGMAETVTLYVDGVSVGGNAINKATNGQGNLFVIGADYNYQQGFTGVIDEVRVSNSVRSPAWILAQFQAASSSFTSFAPAQTM